MAGGTFAFRLSAEGGDKVDREFRSVQGTAEALQRALDTMPSAATAASTALDRIAAGTTRAANDTEKLTRQQVQLARQLDRLAAAHDPYEAALQRAARAEVLMGQAQNAGVELSERRIRGLMGEVTAYEKVAQSMREAEAAARQATAAAGQANANSFAGVGAPATSEDYAKRQADLQAYGRELDGLRAKFVPLAAAQQQYRAALEEIGRAHRVGAIDEQERATATLAAGAAYSRQVRAMSDVDDTSKKVTNSLKLQSHQWVNLSYQVQDAAVQLAGGQNPLLILIQQAPQAVDAVGGVGNAFRLASTFVTPFNVGIAATVVALGASVLAAERTDRAILDLSARLRTTRSDFQELAKDAEVVARRLAGSSNLSTTDARSAAGALSSSRDYERNTAELERMVRVANDAARAFGTTVPQEAEKLARALERPGQAARQLVDQGFRTMDDALRRQIELLEAAGNKSEAARLYQEAYARGVAGAAAAMTPFQKAMDEASQAATRLWNEVRPALEGLGRPVMEGIAAGIGQITTAFTSTRDVVVQIAEAWKTVRGLIPTNPDGSIGSLGPGVAPAPVVSGASPVTGASDIAARILHGEAAGQGDRGMAAAAAVIVNRARLTGTTPDQVVMAPGQFEPWGNQATRNNLMALDPQDYAAAKRILEGVMSGAISDPTGGATHFFAPDLQARLGRARPSWAPEGQGVRIGGHEFYSRPEDFGRGSAVAGPRGRLLAEADEGLRNVDPRQVQLRKVEASIGLYEEASRTEGLDPDRARDYAERLKELRAEAEKLRDPMEVLRRQGNEQARVLREASGAARELADAEMKGVQAARAAGENAAGQAARGLEERRQAQARLNAQFLTTIEDQERATSVTRANADATLQGAAAAREATIRQQAQVDVLKFSTPLMADYAGKVEMLVRARREQRAAEVDLQTGTLVSQQRDEIALLEKEAELIGLTTERRQAELAVMREQQRVRNAGGDPNSAASLEAQANIRRLASQRASNQQLENSWNDLARAGEQAFD
ncbi:MAG TPA: phage tail length tape measure family protein, partial [Geminicoccaceae bacterium]